MLKKYLSDLAFMQMLNLLIKPVWILVIDRAVQNALPKSVYGNYFALFNFSIMFFIILDLGLNGFSTTQVARDNRKIGSLAGSIIGLKILLSFVYVLVVFCVGFIMGYTSQEFSILLLLCILQIFTSFNQYLRTIVASLQKFKWDGVFMVLDRVIIVALCAVLIWGSIPGFKLSIFNFIWVQIVGIGLVFFSLIIFLFEHLRHLKISFNFSKLIPLMERSWPFAVLMALMGLYNNIDSVMLKTLVNDGEAGEYALGFRLYYALLMFAQIFSGVLLPFFSKNMAERGIIELVASYTSKLLMWIGLTAACLSFAYQNELMSMLYPDKSSIQAAQAFSILMFGFVGSVLILVYGTLLTARLSLRELNIAAGVTLCINLFFNAIFIPKYGASGAAFTTLVSQLLFGIICYALCYKKFKFVWVKSELFKQILGVVLLFATIILAKQYFNNIVVHLGVITLTVILVAYLFKLFQASQLKSLLSK